MHYHITPRPRDTYIYPSLVRASVLDANRYTRSTPQALLVVVQFRDRAALRVFSTSLVNAKLSSPFFFFFSFFRFVPSFFFILRSFRSYSFIHSFIHSFTYLFTYYIFIYLFVYLFIYLLFFVFLSLQRITARPPLHFPRRDTASPPTVSGFTFDCFAYIAVRTCRKGMLRVEKKSLRRMQRRPRLSHSAQGRAGTCMRIDNHASRFVENPDFRWRRSLAIVALPMVNDKPEPPSHSFSLR